MRRSTQSLRKISQYIKLIPYTFLFLPLFVHAQILPCSPLHPNPRATNVSGCTFADLFTILVNIYNFLLGLAAIVFMAMIVISGIRMLVFYLSENPAGDLKDAKYTLTRAITGFVIIVAAYLIVRTMVSFFGVGVDQYFNGGFLQPRP